MRDEAIKGWWVAPRKTPSRQARYADLAIDTAITLRLAFQLRLRQVEGFMTSIFSLMKVDLVAPDHTTLRRRAKVLPTIANGDWPQGPLDIIIDSTGLKIYGAGKWSQEKHNVRARRSWRKLHLANFIWRSSFGDRCKQRHDCRVDAHRYRCRRSVSSRLPTGSDGAQPPA